jgi:hypothetical protein
MSLNIIYYYNCFGILLETKRYISGIFESLGSKCPRHLISPEGNLSILFSCFSSSRGTFYESLLFFLDSRTIFPFKELVIVGVRPRNWD